ncbi:hypothetical protein EB232_09890 [Mesorhizobium sp. NZP2077]|nr:hypothetical protein EB232_09890 [Mesorhizobium sp. NZP2077]
MISRIVKERLFLARQARALSNTADNPKSRLYTFAKLEALLIGRKRVLLLHSMRLHDEVSLCASNLWFAGIAVHGDETASAPREEIIIAALLSTTADFHQLVRQHNLM